MSILDKIQEHCNATPPQLYLLEPSVNNTRAALVSQEKRRVIYVSPQIHSFLNSDHPLAADAQADLESFILGQRLVVALRRNHKDCRFARLDRPEDEVWEVRVLDADPQLRLFGRFAALDTFVALIGPVDRDTIAGDEDFEEIKRECQREWDRLFGLVDRPVVGRTIHDYVSEPVRVV